MKKPEAKKSRDTASLALVKTEPKSAKQIQYADLAYESLA
jgi:hypothetical protein